MSVRDIAVWCHMIASVWLSPSPCMSVIWMSVICLSVIWLLVICPSVIWLPAICLSTTYPFPICLFRVHLVVCLHSLCLSAICLSVMFMSHVDKSVGLSTSTVCMCLLSACLFSDYLVWYVSHLDVCLHRLCLSVIFLSSTVVCQSVQPQREHRAENSSDASFSRQTNGRPNDNENNAKIISVCSLFDETSQQCFHDRRGPLK